MHRQSDLNPVAVGRNPRSPGEEASRSPLRTRVESFIRKRFAESYGAQLREFMPCFAVLLDPDDGIAAAAARIERETVLKVLCFPKEKEFFIGFRINA